MKLVIMIFNISFFVGIFFFVFCDIQAQIYAVREEAKRTGKNYV